MGQQYHQYQKKPLTSNIEHKNRSRHMSLEIYVLAWECFENYK